MEPRIPAWRIPLLGGSLLILLFALWAGLLRLGLRLPLLLPSLPMAHGPLMVSGFMGTLISLERAVALKRRWMAAGPALTALGSLLLIAGINPLAGEILITLGSLCLIAVFVVILRHHQAPYTLVMAAGAACWLVGNILWTNGWPVFRVVLWWAGFLILTVAGERLELSRLLRLSWRVQALFLSLSGLFLGSLAVWSFAFNLGARLAGAALLGLAMWLLRYDIARRTVRQPGLPRFAAACLLTGYAWLGIAGLMGMIFGGLAVGFGYDATLHALFLGFIISMVFGHAPLIFPAVIGLPVRFHRVYYLHFALLHLSLLLRVAGDLLWNNTARQWGGLFNEIAILVFLGSTAYSLLKARATAFPVTSAAVQKGIH